MQGRESWPCCPVRGWQLSNRLHSNHLEAWDTGKATGTNSCSTAFFCQVTIKMCVCVCVCWGNVCVTPMEIALSSQSWMLSDIQRLYRWTSLVYREEVYPTGLYIG